jgi:hypothetical protein
LLIALVLVTTLLLAWAGPTHPVSFVKNELAHLSGKSTTAKPPSAKEKEHPRVASLHPATPVTSTDQGPHPAASDYPPAAKIPDISALAPVALPVNPTDDGLSMSPQNPTIPAAPTPALPALPASAFAARDIAEKSLDPGIVSPTGHAELLKIIGNRDEAQITPSTWTFYFFDKGAAGHARIVKVSGGQVIKSGEDLVDFASPYSDSAVLPEDQIQKDSTDALQIAQALLPGTPVASSEFTLMQQKNSVPMWKVALWTKNADGEQHKLGDVTLLSENGTLISRNLKP